jgi:anti-sigma factor RsiW
MDHEEFKKDLFALYDGELSDTERREVIAHIEDCPECRQAYTHWERIAKTFLRSLRPETSEAFVQRVMERIKIAEDSRRLRWRPAAIRWLSPALGLGTAALLFFISLPHQGPVLSTEGLLLANGHEEHTSEWVFRREAPQADDLLAMVLEGS